MKKITVNELYVGYSSNENIRKNSSSGGVVTGVLTYMLTEKIIDGAIVSKIISKDNKVSAISELVSSTEELIEFAGSSYIDTPVLSTVKRLDAYDGKVAVVALPCQIRAIRKLLNNNQKINKKVVIIIGLFCRGNVTNRFYDDYFVKGKIDTGSISKIKIKRGYLDGKVIIKKTNENHEELSFKKMNFYRIAGIHAKTLCLWCHEHLANEADISVGDIFTPEYRKHEIKHSSIIPRSKIGVEILKSMSDKNATVIKYFGLANYIKYFRKIENFGSNLKNRYIAAKLTGLKNNRRIKQKCKSQSINVFHIISWSLFFLNYRISKTKYGRCFLYKMPSFFIKANAVFIKILSRF